MVLAQLVKDPHLEIVAHMRDIVVRLRTTAVWAVRLISALVGLQASRDEATSTNTSGHMMQDLLESVSKQLSSFVQFVSAVRISRLVKHEVTFLFQAIRFSDVFTFRIVILYHTFLESSRRNSSTGHLASSID